MKSIHKTVAAIAMMLSMGTVIAMTGPTAAATTAPQHTSYCLSYAKGGTDCGFTSKAQCEATASGLAGECSRDVFPDREEFHW